MTHSLNQLINDKDVCRTAPATPGLLNIYTYIYIFLNLNSCHRKIDNLTFEGYEKDNIFDTSIWSKIADKPTKKINFFKSQKL